MQKSQRFKIPQMHLSASWYNFFYSLSNAFGNWYHNSNLRDLILGYLPFALCQNESSCKIAHMKMFPPTCSFSGTMHINLIFKGFKTRFETEAHGFLNPGPQSHRPGAVLDYNQPRIKDYSPLHIFLLITRLHFKHFFIRLEQSSDRERKSNTTVFTVL